MALPTPMECPVNPSKVPIRTATTQNLREAIWCTKTMRNGDCSTEMDTHPPTHIPTHYIYVVITSVSNFTKGFLHSWHTYGLTCCAISLPLSLLCTYICYLSVHPPLQSTYSVLLSTVVLGFKSHFHITASLRVWVLGQQTLTVLHLNSVSPHHDAQVMTSRDGLHPRAHTIRTITLKQLVHTIFLP